MSASRWPDILSEEVLMEDDTEAVENAKRLASGPFGAEMARIASSYAKPIFWAKRLPVDGTRNEISNGTAFFLDLGKKICGVTAAHVYDSYMERPGDPQGCRIGSSTVPFDLEKRTISRGRKVDLFTFDVSRSEAESTSATINVPREWPPQPPEVNQALVFAGYPGHETRVPEPFLLQFGCFSGAGMIESVRERDFSGQVDRENMVPLPGRPLPEAAYDFAGASGGPVLRVHRGDVLYWDLAGVIYQCGGQDLVELIKIARTDLICSDGVVAA